MATKRVSMAGGDIAHYESVVADLERQREAHRVELGRLQRELSPAGYDVDQLEAALRSKTARQHALELTIGRLDDELAAAGAELQRVRADAAREQYVQHIQELRHELQAAVDALDGAAGAFARAAAAGHDATAQKRIFEGGNVWSPFSGIGSTANELTQTAERWRRWLDAQVASNEFWQ